MAKGLIDVVGEAKDFPFVEISQGREGPNAIAVEGAVTHGQFRLIGGVEDHGPGLVAPGVEDGPSQSALNVLIAYSL